VVPTDTTLHFHLETEEIPAFKTSCAVQNTRNLSVWEKHYLHIKAFVSKYRTEMEGGKLYHILHVDTDLLATCEILTVGLLRIEIFWNIMSHQLVTVISISKDCSTFIFRVEQTLRKVGNYLPCNMAKRP